MGQLADAVGLPAAFVADATNDLDTLELKDRVRHIAAAMRTHLSSDYPTALAQIVQGLPPPNNETTDLTDAW